ncbi:hypothetical protein N7530_003458 [Penicillium desertorum]|uniref:Uncharacterized protein n=1 Tax=Penicillium desertorum TaxID=1303715 RepID=A0A9X0BPF9_9EURO|nr:hypothetical protein N7530_003458 [Penicillium desertorum]
MEPCKMLYLNDRPPINVDNGRAVSSRAHGVLIDTFPSVTLQSSIRPDSYSINIDSHSQAAKESLQGTIIPIFFGQDSFNDHDALVISEVNGITLHDLAKENLGVQHETLEKHLKSALSAFDDHEAVYWDAKLDNFLFCAGVNPEQSKVMIVDHEQVEFPRPLEPWLGNINSRSAPDLISKFKYRQNPNRPPSPAGTCYQPGVEDGEAGWESNGLQRTRTVNKKEASQVDTGSGIE